MITVSDIKEITIMCAGDVITCPDTRKDLIITLEMVEDVNTSSTYDDYEINCMGYRMNTPAVSKSSSPVLELGLVTQVSPKIKLLSMTSKYPEDYIWCDNNNPVLGQMMGWKVCLASLQIAKEYGIIL